MVGAIAPILPSQKTARLCAAILDCRDTAPAPPFSTAVNTRKGGTGFKDVEMKSVGQQLLRRLPRPCAYLKNMTQLPTR